MQVKDFGRLLPAVIGAALGFAAANAPDQSIANVCKWLFFLRISSLDGCPQILEVAPSLIGTLIVGSLVWFLWPKFGMLLQSFSQKTQGIVVGFLAGAAIIAATNFLYIGMLGSHDGVPTSRKSETLTATASNPIYIEDAQVVGFYTAANPPHQVAVLRGRLAEDPKNLRFAIFGPETNRDQQVELENIIKNTLKGTSVELPLLSIVQTPLSMALRYGDYSHANGGDIQIMPFNHLQNYTVIIYGDRGEQIIKFSTMSINTHDNTLLEAYVVPGSSRLQ